MRNGASRTVGNIVIGYQAINGTGFGGDKNIVIGYQAGHSLASIGNIGNTRSHGHNIIIGPSASLAFSGSVDQLIIASGSSPFISGSLSTGDIIFYNTASAPNFSGSFQGDGSQLTNLPPSNPFPFTGDAQITGSLIVSSSGITSIGDITASNKILIGNELNIGQSPYNGHYKGNINIYNSNGIGTAVVIKQNAASVQNIGNITIGSGIDATFLTYSNFYKSFIGGSLSINTKNTVTNSFTSEGASALYVGGNTEISGSVNISGSGGLTVESSGSTVFNVIGSEGDLFTITDNLTTGSLFAVKDINGFPLLDVTANSTTPDTVTVGQSNLILDSGSLQVTGSTGISGSLQIQGIADVSASIAAASTPTPAFPFTGDAQITGSLKITGSFEAQSELLY